MAYLIPTNTSNTRVSSALATFKLSLLFILRAIHTQVYLLSLPSRGLRGIFFFCLRW